MKEHGSWFPGKEQRRFNRPSLLTHQIERFVPKQRENLIQLLINLRPDYRKYLVIEHRRKKSRWADIFLQETLNQLALFNLFAKPYQGPVVVIQYRFVLGSGITEQALIGK